MRPMRTLRYPGWILLLAAFAAAAAEVMVPPAPGAPGVFVSAYELWYTAWPGSLVRTQIHVERLAPFLWDPLIVAVLTLPGWFLFGLPGVMLTWMSRPRGFADARARAEVRKYEEAMLFYDDLIREARSQGMDRDGDDMSPDHSGHDTLDEIERQSEEEDELYSMERAEAMRAEIARRKLGLVTNDNAEDENDDGPEKPWLPGDGR